MGAEHHFHGTQTVQVYNNGGETGLIGTRQVADGKWTDWEIKTVGLASALEVKRFSMEIEEAELIYIDTNPPRVATQT